jgi:hypothetical protein
MTDQPDNTSEPEQFLLCSRCYTPTAVALAHVVPRWNPTARRVLTAYRCRDCWMPTLTELRTAVESADPEVLETFWEFLHLHGFRSDSDRFRREVVEEQQRVLLLMIEAMVDGRLTFDP